MNLIEAGKMLESIDDQQLQQQMQQPAPGMPQYLVLSEMQRRKQLRDSAAAMQNGKPSDRVSVADELRSGIAAVPQMAQGGPGFVDGGIVGYASGGLTAFQGDRSPITSQQMYDMSAQSADPSSFWETVKRYGRDAAMRIFSQNPDDAAARSARMNSGAPSFANIPDANPMDAHLAGNYPAEPQQQAQGTVGFTPPPPLPAASSAPRQSVGASPPPLPAGAPLATKGGPALMPLPDKPEQTDPKLLSEFLPQVDSAMGDDGLGSIMTRADQRIGTLKDKRSNAVNMAMINAGLSMMGAKSGNFAQVVGQGGLAGTKSYTDTMTQADEQEEKLQLHKDAIQVAQAAAKRGNVKLAAEIMEKANADINARNRLGQQMYSNDVNYVRSTNTGIQNSERQAQRDAAAAARSEAGANSRLDKQLTAQKAALDKQLLMEDRKDARQQTSLNATEFNKNYDAYSKDTMAKMSGEPFETWLARTNPALASRRGIQTSGAVNYQDYFGKKGK